MWELSHVEKSRGVKYFRCLLVDVQYSRRVFLLEEEKNERESAKKRKPHKKAELPGFFFALQNANLKIPTPAIRQIYIRGKELPRTEPYRIYSKSRMHMFPSRKRTTDSYPYSRSPSSFAFHSVKIFKTNLIKLKGKWKFHPLFLLFLTI